jgi:hypothetical protein
MKYKNIIIFSIFLIIYLFKYLLIENFGVNVPLGDQWDAEAFLLYKPYLEGNLHFFDLFSQHNEHRIFCTRILNLSIFIINNYKWDTILTMKIQALILSSIPTFILFFYLKYAKKYSIFTIIFLLIIFCLPIGYENLLWGFQSQFYFMIFFSFISFYFATSPLVSSSKTILIIVICLLSYLNVASGFISSLIVSIIFCFRYLKTQKKSFLLKSFLFFFQGCLLFTFIIPVNAHKFLKSQDIFDFINSIELILKWPFKEYSIMFFLLWIPIFFILFNYLINYKKIKNINLFYISIIIWIIVQIMGISYARGGKILTLIQNRYTDIFILSGVFLILYLESNNYNNKVHRINIHNFIKFLYILIFSHYSYVNFKNFKNEYNEKQSMLYELNTLYKIKSISRTDALNILKNSTCQYPYPYKYRLWDFMNDPTINKILPSTILTK